MHPNELESLLVDSTVEEIMRAIDDPARQEEHGWDLHDWTYHATPASVCFLHWDERGKPSDMVVAVRASQERRDHLARLVADFPLPAKLVLIT